VTFEEAVAALASQGIENPRGEARLLLAHALGIDRDASLTAPPLTPPQAERLAALVARRAAHEPLAYITGHKGFWTLDLAVGAGVLVPRPETETLIEEAIRLVADRNAPLHIADLGTGTGALLLAALAEFPNATGMGYEAAPQAFVWARRNAERLMPGRAHIVQADWAAAEGPFDLVFSNPPYIANGEIARLAPDVRAFEPHAALDGGPDGLAAYRSLAAVLPGMLRPGGHAILELGAGQLDQVASLFADLRILHVTPDLAGIARALVLQKTPYKP
jgi:release factor glutamine methyltransferase